MDRLNGELRGFILFVRYLENRLAEENMNGEQVKAVFAEMYLPTSLFSLAIQILPTTYRALRTWLNEHGAALTPHSSHRIITTLATTMYSENEETEAAIAIIRVMISASRSRPTSTNDRAASSYRSNN